MLYFHRKFSSGITLDWASNSEDQRLETKYFLTIAGGAFSCTSRAQRTIALSSTKTEYMALLDCSQQCV